MTRVSKNLKNSGLTNPVSWLFVQSKIWQFWRIRQFHNCQIDYL